MPINKPVPSIYYLFAQSLSHRICFLSLDFYIIEYAELYSLWPLVTDLFYLMCCQGAFSGAWACTSFFLCLNTVPLYASLILFYSSVNGQLSCFCSLVMAAGAVVDMRLVSHHWPGGTWKPSQRRALLLFILQHIPFTKHRLSLHCCEEAPRQRQLLGKKIFNWRLT